MVQFQDFTSSKTAHRSTWAVPPLGYVKVNFDATFLPGNSYNKAYAARDHGGRCLGWFVCRFIGRPGPVVGETRAALCAISWVQARGWNSINLEGDCLQVIHSLRDKDSDSLPAFIIYRDESLRIVRNFSIFSCSFIKRSGNCLAHALAHLNVNSSTSIQDDVFPAYMANLI